MKFEGAYTALVTPMLEDGAVDYDGLQKNIEFQLSQGISGVVPVGTTGESPTVTYQEHDDIAVKTLDYVKDRCTVIVGTGSNCTETSLACTMHAAQAGAKAVLMADCYYNGPSSIELMNEYYAPVAELVPEVAIIPYVIPGRTSTALSVEDLAILAASHPNVCAVKEATGDLTRMAKTRELCGVDFAILSGDDDLTYKMLVDPKIAANGVISVMTNVVPKAMQQMVSAARSGDTAKAEELHKALEPLFSVVTVKVENERTLPDGKVVKVTDKYRNPVAIKTLMNGLGLPSGPYRAPLGKMTEPGVDLVREAVKTVWKNNPEILAPVGEFYGIDIEARVSDERYWLPLIHL